jgi:hypothetical protein
MQIKIQPESAERKVTQENLQTYVEFRGHISKPSSEDAHLRHILRFYIARACVKQGADEIYIMPTLDVDGQSLTVDVASKHGDTYSLAICEPASVTPETEDKLALLKNAKNADTLVLHSQYGKPGDVEEKFKTELDTKRFKLMAIVPPPFDDVYEYDIWMFEETFREVFRSAA